MDCADDLLDIDPLKGNAQGRDVRMPELPLNHRQRHPFSGEVDRVSMPELVFVPTSAQTSISRPGRYADVCEKFLLSAHHALRSVGIFGSLQDGHERIGDAMGAELPRTGPCWRRRRHLFLGHVGVQLYVGCRDSLVGQLRTATATSISGSSRSTPGNGSRRALTGVRVMPIQNATSAVYGSHFLIESAQRAGRLNDAAPPCAAHRPPPRSGAAHHAPRSPTTAARAWSVDHAEQRTDRQIDPGGEPRSEMI
jgi:hypothetical protein